MVLSPPGALRTVAVGIHTGGPELFLHPADAQRLGLRTQDRVHLDAPGRSRVPAVVNLADGLIPEGSAGVSAELAALLPPATPEVQVHPAPKPVAVEFIRRKLDGFPLSPGQLESVVRDVAAGHLTSIELTAWASAIHARGMDLDETVAYTRAMAETGERIEWAGQDVSDVHSIGGLPGNKYAPITVAIAAAAGLTVPKTSSRAISSACGTADFMEVLCPVDLGPRRIREVALEAGACLAWGGGVGLAPADDAIIRVEYPLGLDPPAQMVASVLAKKLAAGVKRVLVDIPMGEGNKVADRPAAERLGALFADVGHRLGLQVECAVTPAGVLLGRCIGPALEAREVIQTIAHGGGPRDLVEKSTLLAGRLLEMAGRAGRGQGEGQARAILADGRAYRTFQRILQAQGGDPGIDVEDIRPGAHRVVAVARSDGPLAIRSSALVSIARAAGAPKAPGAGIEFLRMATGDADAGEPVFHAYTETANRIGDVERAIERLTPLQARQERPS